MGVGPTWGPQFMAQPLMVVVLCARVGPTWGLHVGGTKGNGKSNGALGAWRASPPTPGGFNIVNLAKFGAEVLNDVGC